MKFWIWNTEEVLALIRWMRAHNERPGTAPVIGFRGFDMQYPQLAIDAVLAYVRQVDPAAIDRFTGYYAEFRPYQQVYPRSTYAGLPAATRGQLREGLQQAYAALRDGRAAYVAASSASEYDRALHSARLVTQAEAYFSHGDNSVAGWRVRDRAMADNAAWLLEQGGSGAKMILWAHNGHIGYLPYEWDQVPSMGGHLREWYGGELVAIGLTGYAGEFNTHSPTRRAIAAQRLPPPPPDSYEAAFRQTDLPRLLLDLRDLPARSRAAGWLWGPRRLRDIGAGYDEDRPEAYYAWLPLPEQFDALIYLQDTTPSARLRS